MNTVLFDLDSTLLPLNENLFMEIYMEELVKKCAPMCEEPKKVVAAVWEGTMAMVKNDGTVYNESRFWDSFSARLGQRVLEIKSDLISFYDNEFHKARAATRGNPLGLEIVRRLRGEGYTVVLATNPMFPPNAVAARLAWIDMEPEDFHYITCYDNSTYCKPNPKYYQEILGKIGKEPGDCLMVGNDVREDGCAVGLGLDFFLVTDHMLNGEDVDPGSFRNGTFAMCTRYIDGLLRDA